MRTYREVSNIIFDFDGVLIDSHKVRDAAYGHIFRSFDKKLVEEYMDYHHYNGGLSRFVKIKYFFNELLGKMITEEGIQKYALEYSDFARDELTKSEYVISDSVNFVKKNAEKYRFFIASGSEDSELKYICMKQGIDKCFVEICGSPTPKIQIVKGLIERHDIAKDDVILIGDAINDYDAAIENGIAFAGYNNPTLRDIGDEYIDSFIKD